MATYYVSNVANNGYSLGVDTNNGTAKTGTAPTGPFLTIAHACTVAASGDTIVVNPSGTAYSESSGSGYLQLPGVTLTIETDQSLVGTAGKATIKASATSRIINSNNALAYTLQDLILDARDPSTGLTVANKSGITNPKSPGVTCVRVDFAGFNTSYAGGAIANGSMTFDRCTMTGANGNLSSAYWVSAFAAGMSYTWLGCTADTISYVLNSTTGQSIASVTVDAASDGTRNSFSNMGTAAFRLPHTATTTTASIKNCDFSGTFGGGYIIGDATSYDAAVTSLTVSHCTFSSTSATGCYFYGTIGSGEMSFCTHTGTSYMWRSNSVNITNFLVHDNTITQTGATADPIQFNVLGDGIKVYNNTITTDATGHVICVGTDGQGTIVGNSNTKTGTINLGQASSNVYIDQPFTLGAATNISKIITSAWFNISAIGSPTGTVSCKLYSDSAGVPGTLLETSEYTLSAANAPSASSKTFEFWFPAHTLLSVSTTYHVVLQYTGTIDGANYLALDSSGTFTPVAQSSPNGTSWTAITSTAAVASIMSCTYEAHDPEVHDNKVTLNSPASITHGCFIAGTIGGKNYRNYVDGGGIPIIFKLADGSNASHPLIAYDNLVYIHMGGAEMGLRDKGCRNSQFYHNTVIISGVSSNCAFFDADFSSGRYNGQPSQNAVCKNNILYLFPGSGNSGSAINMGNGSSAQPTYQNFTFENNLIYLNGSGANCWYDYATGNQVIKSYAQLQSAGYNLNGKNLEPLLSSPIDATNKWYTPAVASDFVPTRVSPAYAMGTALSATVPTDYAGTSFSTSHPCVGAYTFTGKFRQNSGLVGGVGGSLGAGL